MTDTNPQRSLTKTAGAPEREGVVDAGSIPAVEELRIEAGKSYLNGHGDHCGPMKEARGRPGLWIDQHGATYLSNGIQWAHHPDSAGNLRAISAADGAKP